jgi:NAD(P)-dependent dehydrogenase (short-subunit alcohol dehydrogenase family)
VSFNIAGNVVVVTGGASGIGRALAERFAREGASVAIVDLDQERCDNAASSLPRAIGVAADVADFEAVEAMVRQVESRLGPIGIYCSNAGVADSGGLGTEEEWDRAWRVHAMAHVHAARAVLPGMLERRSGAVVITASAAGLLMLMQSAVYTVTKHAAVAFAEWLAVAYGDTGVQFHCVCPQGVRTPMVMSDSRGGAEVVLSGELIEPEVVADAVVTALDDGRFLVLPHPEVRRYEQGKVDDRDRWLSGMRRLRTRLEG